MTEEGLKQRIEKLKEECHRMGKDLYVKGCRDGLGEALTELDKTIAEIEKEQKSKCVCYLMKSGVRAWCSSCKIYNKVLKALDDERSSAPKRRVGL